MYYEFIYIFLMKKRSHIVRQVANMWVVHAFSPPMWSFSLKIMGETVANDSHMIRGAGSHASPQGGME
jgi:hypothetical protein